MNKFLRLFLASLALFVFGQICAEDYSGYYRIKGPRSGRMAVDASSKLSLSTATSPTAGNLAEVWEFRSIGNDGSYAIINAQTGAMVQTQTKTETDHATSTSTCGIFYIKKSGTKYVISSAADFSGRTCWHENSTNKIVVWSSGTSDTNSFWQLAEVTGDDLAAAQENIAGFNTNIEKAIAKTKSMAVLENGGIFRLKSRYDHYAQENEAAHTMVANQNLVANDLKQIWIVEKLATGFYLRNANTGRYMPAEGGSDVALVTTETPTTIYIKGSEYSAEYYTISWKSDFSGATCLHENARGNIVKWNANTSTDGVKYSDWSIEPLTEADTVNADIIRDHLAELNGIVTNITDGYYRLKSYKYSDRSMTENIVGTAVTTAPTDENDFTQLWYITVANGKVTLRNAISENYIRNNAGSGAQFRTNKNNNYNTFTATLNKSNTEPTFNFYGTSMGLSCASSSNSYKVVGAASTLDESQWILTRVKVDEADIEQARKDVMADLDIIQNATAYNTKLQKFFLDNACTVLRSEYAAMTEADLRAAMKEDGLPTIMQDMAVCVLTDKWDADETRSKYVKLFKIQDVQIYSDNKVWGDITKVGPFAELINPTGIQGKAGDVVYIYADNVPTDADVKLVAQIAYDTEYRNKGTLTLKKGLNAWQMPSDGEIFIGYTLTNPNKYLKNYPTIRIHVEGGTVNGCWDLSRGMTNSDWSWLKKNMFQGEFLHVKGIHTVLNLVRSKVTAATDVTNIMKGWDYSFMGLEYLIGNDGQWDGRYFPVANPRHSYSGNPNWGGYGGSNHTSITSSYLFNYDNFYNGNVWEILHELGHGHQGPINVAGTTEITNNSLAQCVSYMMGRNYSRGDGVQKLIQLFNYQSDEANGHNPNLRGWTWTDYTRYATPHYDASLHATNHLLYQLYLFFEVQRHCPGFMPRLYDELRANPIQKGSSVANPTYYYNDYFRLAEACAKVSGYDLWEFFEAYGFWKYYDETISISENDDDAAAKAAGIKFIGDYGGYYMKLPVRGNAADEKRINDLRNYMHSLPLKAPNVMFLDDRIETSYVRSDSYVASIRKALVGQELLKYWNLPSQGDFGHYTKFDSKDRSINLSYTIGSTIDSQDMKTDKGGAWNYTLTGRTITIKGGGLLGIKIYDPDGKLCWLANTRSFIVPEEIAEGLEQGTYKLKMAVTENKDLEFDKAGLETGMTSYENANAGDNVGSVVRDLQGRIVTNLIPGQIYIKGKNKFVAE